MEVVGRRPGVVIVLAASSVIDEYPAHQLCRHGKEVRSVLPLHVPVVNEANIRLIDESRCLKRVAHVFATHVVFGQAAQLLVHQRCQSIQGCFVAAPPGH